MRLSPPPAALSPLHIQAWWVPALRPASPPSRQPWLLDVATHSEERLAPGEGVINIINLGVDGKQRPRSRERVPAKNRERNTMDTYETKTLNINSVGKIEKYKGLRVGSGGRGGIFFVYTVKIWNTNQNAKEIRWPNCQRNMYWQSIISWVW